MPGPQPHDLLWGMTCTHLPAAAPPWAHALLQETWPVVVRRDLPQAGRIPVGIRGHARCERLAGWLPASAITASATPESMRKLTPKRDLPQWRALTALGPVLDATGLAWGIAGAAGFELATGHPVLRVASDLDLVLRTPQPFSRGKARALLAECVRAVCRIDLQLQTPNGGVALAEWAGSATRVLVKGAHAPQLLSDPWDVAG